MKFFIDAKPSPKITIYFWMFFLAYGLPDGSFGQEGSSTAPIYRIPPKEVVDIIDAPLTPDILISPRKDWILFMSKPTLPSINELAEPELRLAGLRIKPATNGRSRTTYYNNLALKRIESLEKKPVNGIPPNSRIGHVSWSPDGKHFAFTLTLEDRIELWAFDISSAKARRLTRRKVNGVYQSPFKWLSDNKTVVCKLIPTHRTMPPIPPEVPTGPVIQESVGKKAPVRTYQDLLKNAYDEALLEYYLSAQIALVPLRGREKVISETGLFASVEPSPDGNYLLVETIKRPFSYIVPIRRFPRQIEVWDLRGQIIHTVADVPLAEEIPLGFGAVRTGPRSVSWRSDTPATLYWVEARDNGDPKAEAEIRDELFIHEAPFDSPPVSLLELAQRYGGVSWGNEEIAIVTDWWWKTRNWRSILVQPAMQDTMPRVLFDQSWEDRYHDPGTPVMKRTKEGTYILRIGTDGRSIFLKGEGASPEGDRPFLDQYNLETNNTRRLWQSEEPYYKRLVDLFDEENITILISKESPTDPRNYYINYLGKDSIRQITHFPHPYPQMLGVQKELIRYKRDDGIPLTGTLYLPPDYTKEKGPLPTLLWAYPQEYKSADAAGQVTDSPYRFVRIRWSSPLLLLTQGYAILDDPSMPIVGEGDEEPNNTYVQQLVSSAKAAIDELVRRGITDPNKVAIGGHSYGAFMVANLLAHSDLFQAGIARSGAYNRTLTPFGFQAEERTFWQASDTYFAMSPFMHADKINEPILLIHGEADNNSGTFPIQSKRLYHALKGLGGTTRLVLLPYESHGYRAWESIMHMWWETIEWLDRYVKNVP